MIRQLAAHLPPLADTAAGRLEPLLRGARLLRRHPAAALRVWARQCECVLAQRLRRGQQMCALYSRLWERHRPRALLRRLRGRWMAGAAGVAGYDWAAHRISEGEIRAHQNEFAYVYELRDKTLCDKCDRSSRICHCDGAERVQRPKLSSFDDWQVFITKSDLVIWRRLHPTGCFEYKVYGSYSDVTGEDFLNVQIDIDYRKQWDTTAVALNVVETDPQPGSNSDIVYWEMLWPKFFANRDYVFNRRYLVDHKTKTLYLVSKSTKHPSCPKEKNKYRIENYGSLMVIRPYTELNKKGIEFSLTYFDNPGVNIPASVTTWVAMKAMPDFLERLREASKRYRIYCKEKGICQICNIMDTHHYKEEVVVPTIVYEYFDDDIVTDNTIYEPGYHIKRLEEKQVIEVRRPPDWPPPAESEPESGPESGAIKPESSSFWRYEEGKGEF